MKKRLLSVFLALLMLCALTACNGDSNSEKFGEIYVEDGFSQNTLIKCVVTEKGPRGVAYEIRNETSYRINVDRLRGSLQIRRGDAWEQAPIDPDYIMVDREPLGWGGICKEVYEGRVNHYKPLHPGEYRIIVSIEIKKPETGAKIEELFAVTPFTVTDEVYGSFETKDGILQNTRVTLSIDGAELPTPLTRIGAVFQNKSVFEIEWREKYAENENYDYLLEVFENGVWKQAPTFGERILKEGGWSLSNYREIEPVDNTWTQGFWRSAQIKGGNPALMDKRYIEPAPGKYRVRVKYAITEAIEGVEIPEGQLEAVAYFTVTAPAQ